MSGILLAKRHGGAKTGIVLPNIGGAWLGGYYAGIIDTTNGNIIAADYFQTRQRHAVILSPKSLEAASTTYKTAGTAAPAECSTRWNGQGATAAMNSSTYPAAYYCAGLSYPSDGASPWYLPAMDELELLYRNLKCSAESNNTDTWGPYTFPPAAQTAGYNPSSDPAGAVYTTSAPGQTTLAAFKTGGAQAIGYGGSPMRYWSATELNAVNAWTQTFSGPSFQAGTQIYGGKTQALNVRPVRRLVLS